jgi:hypothetical protein
MYKSRLAIEIELAEEDVELAYAEVCAIEENLRQAERDLKGAKEYLEKLKEKT